jgi:hypothetical protein
MATGWGNKTWGASEWGDLSDETVVVSSVAAQTSVDSVTTEANADVIPTTLSATFTLQGAVAGASADVTPTGILFNIVTGNEGIGIGVPVTGVSATTTTGTVTIQDEFLIGSGWGRETWGSFVWGDNYSVQLVGIPLSVVTGNEDAFTDVVVAVSGQSLQTAITPVGTQANADHEIAASLLITSAQGDVTTEGTALVEPTGISLQSTVGQVEAAPKQEVDVTGVSATINIGNEDTSGNANVFPTGSSATFAVGDITSVSGYDATGSSISGTVGQVTVTGTANIIPTSITLTVSTITPNIIAWAEVNTGVNVTWTPVDLAA